MNYIKEIKSFWKAADDLGLTPSQGYLYLFLLEQFNVRMWPKAIFLTNKNITCAMRMTEKTLISNRSKLVKIGLIQYTSGDITHRKSKYEIENAEVALAKLLGKTTVEITVETTGETTGQTTPQTTGEITGISGGTLLYNKRKQNLVNKNDARLVKKSSNSFNQKEEKNPSPSCAAPLPLELQERHKVVFSLFDFPEGALPQSDLYLMQFEAYEALVHEGYLTYVMDFARWAAGGWKKKDYTKELSRFRSHTNKSKRNGIKTQRINYASIDYSKGFDD